MTIGELADILELELIIRRYPNQQGRYCAKFEGAEIKEDKHSSILISVHGNAYSPLGAIDNYINDIRGKWMVINAASPDERREFSIPNSLTLT